MKMAKTSVKKSKTAARKSSVSKAKASRKTAVSKRTTAKKSVRPKAKAAGKAVARKRASAKKHVRPKAKAAGKAVTKKRASAKKHVRPKAKAAGKAVTKKRASSRKHVRPKAKAAGKAVAKKRASSRKHVTPKAKAAGKAVAKKRASARKHVTPKAKAAEKAIAKKRVSAKKHVTPKVEAAEKTVVSKRASAKKHVTPKAKAVRKPTKQVVRKRSQVTRKSEFDFNAWLLPTLDLEQYEPHSEQETGIMDQTKGSTRYAWIGVGQCGGRLAKSFYDLGYKKVLAVNTTHHDLDLLDIPKNQKFLMDIGQKGAGKDMGRAREAVQQHQQEILHLARQTFASQVDHIMICFGAGGGTGSGSVVELIEIAKRYARYVGLKNPDKRVGVIMTLPTVGEASSPLVAENAWRVATELNEMASSGKMSPLIIIDNDKINKMYPGMTVSSFWPSINNTVTTLFDIFNKLSALSSRYTSFDPTDYHSIMEAGGCAIMGLTKVAGFGDKFAISEAMKKNLEKTLLAGGFDLTTSKLAGCVVVGGRKLMTSVKGLQDNIDYAFDNLSDITGQATIHRGIYEDNRECLRVYTIIGGLDICTARLQELRSRIPVEVG
jgi:cell division GTPase FtsZ